MVPSHPVPRNALKILAGVIAGVLLALSSPVRAEPVPGVVEPGQAAILQCETGWDNVHVTPNEVTAVCATEPSPTATPTATPAPTTAPSPTPTPAPTATPVPTATVAPTPSPTATPAPPTNANVSGIHIPPPFPGYQREHFTEFPNTQTLGQNPHPDTLQYLQPRPDVARDCTYNDSSGRGKYCWRATTSEHDGVLDMWLHTETGSCKTSGFTHQHNGNGGCNYVAGPKWTLPDQTDFIISYVAKLDDIPGRKVAYLRWCGPRVGEPGYCEDNFVEAKLEPGPRGNAFHHHESRKTKQGQQLNIELDEWHLYQMHVKPGQFVDFYVDGELVLHATQHVTTNDSYWVFQSETYLGGQSIPIPHNQGHLLLDSYAVDLPQ